MEKDIHESDALQHPPSFDEMVELIKKLFTDYLEDIVRPKAFTADEIEKSWVRYKTLNHLYQDTPQPGAVWVKAVDRLPGWGVPVQWRCFNGQERGFKETLAEMIHVRPVSLHIFEWLDESGSPAAGREETEGVKAVVDALTTIYGTMIDPVMARQRSADMLNMANQALCKYDKERELFKQQKEK